MLAQLRSPLVDVADQVLIGLIEQLKAAQSSLALEPDLAEFAAQRSEVLLALSTSFLPKIPDSVVEQSAAATDVVDGREGLFGGCSRS